MMPYERLHAWKACDDLTIAVYKATEAFPRHDDTSILASARICFLTALVSSQALRIRHTLQRDAIRRRSERRLPFLGQIPH